MPLRRPSVKWYNERVDCISKFMMDGIKAMISDRNINNVAAINNISLASQQFDQDQTHLTEPSAAIFLEVVLEAAERFFDAPLVDLTGPNAGTDGSLEARLENLEKAFKRQQDKSVSDDLMFARTREDIDAGTNKMKEDRIVINGLTSPTPLPTEPRQKIEALKTIVMSTFLKLIPDFAGKVVYLSPGKQPNQPIEVKLDKPEYAIAMRKAFAEKRKKKELDADTERLFMSNCVNLATRVRVDIMKAIAKKLTNGKDLAYVAGFTSRPMMHMRSAGAPVAHTKPLKSFTFIDSVSRFGKMLSIEDLETAYGRAGRSFNGQLKQNFVVLNETDQQSLQSFGGYRNPGEAGSSTMRQDPSRGSGRGGGGGAAGQHGHGPARGVKRPGDGMEGKNSKK
jgi:hypothetical protein